MFKIFRGYHNLIAVISEKKDGTMKLTGDSLCNKKVIEDRKIFFFEEKPSQNCPNNDGSNRKKMKI